MNFERLRTGAWQALKALSGLLGPREAALLVGLILVARGIGMLNPAAGVFVPGAVLVYVAIAGLR